MAAIELPLNEPSLYWLTASAMSPMILSHPDVTNATTSKSLNGSAAPPSIVRAPSSGANTTPLAASANGTPGQAYSSSLSSTTTQTDILLSLPPPVLRLLVVGAPLVDALTLVSQLLTWTHPNRFAPFLVPICWIGITLGGEAILRYGFNGALLLLLGLGWIAGRGGKKYNSASARNPTVSDTSKNIPRIVSAPGQNANQVITPAAFEKLLDQASTLSRQMQSLKRASTPLLGPLTWQDPSLSFAWVNLLLTSYPFYLILTYFAPIKHILCVSGLIALLWHAPWFAVIRKTLWASLFVRRSARFSLRLLQGDLRLASLEVTQGQQNIGMLARLRSIRQIWLTNSTAHAMSTSVARARSASDKKGDVSVVSKEAEALEVQYLFTIFENQRWWIGLEWTQALLPNERPSWSDPTHAACTPPGSFVLPVATSINAGTIKKTYTWKWLDPEWRIRGTAGVMISPSTIGANANPPASNTAPPSNAKDLVNTLGDWKNMLGSKKEVDSTPEKGRRGSATSLASEEKKDSSHARKGSGSIFGDLLKDVKPTLQANLEKVNANSKEAVEAERTEKADMDADPARADDLPGHPHRIDDTNNIAQDLESADWIVDKEGWVYADNHWEKPTSKGGMGRYTRRRAWVRRAIVVEQIEPALLPVKSETLQPKVSEISATADLKQLQ